MGDRRKWLAADEDVANSEDLKISLIELKEQLESLEEADISFMQIAKQTRNERGAKLLQIFEKEKEMYIASRARWGAQLKGLVAQERRCQEEVQEVELLSKRKTRSSGWPHGRHNQNT